MNACILCLAAVFPADPNLNHPTQPVPLYVPAEEFDLAIRGQNGAAYEEPYYNESPQGSTYVAPPATGLWNPMAAPPMTYDPFMGQPGPAIPAAPGYGGVGPQPYKMGFSHAVDVSWLPKENVQGGVGADGDLGIFGVDVDFKYARPSHFPGWMFAKTLEFDLRTWDGPQGPIGLPGQVFRFGIDFELTTPETAGWGAELGFNPSLNSDFEQELTGDAWNWDGRGMLLFRHSPQWQLVLGVGYWDRVNDRVIPYAGVVYTPDPRWEFRILFPEARISYFAGNYGGMSSWYYVRGDYHVEAYQIEREPIGLREQIELEDYRILFGHRLDNGTIAGFIEAGWVFGRNVDFAHGTPGFDISSGFIGQLGLRF